MIVAIFASRLGACAGAEDLDVTAREQPLESSNGTWLNGTWLNGTWLNGTTIDGQRVWNVALSGSKLTGWFRGRTIGGEDFEGAKLSGLDGNGNPVTLRIDQVDPASSNGVWTYRLSYASGGGWVPVCGDANTRAVAVSGRWDPRSGVSGGGAKIDDDAITFACRGLSAIAKCVDMGYRPWASYLGQSLDRHHQACVRMVRADLCGDGTSYTQNGRAINVYDALGIQQDAGASLLSGVLEWAFEAEWTPDGSRCISVDARDRFLDAGMVPTCLVGKVNLLCGSWWRFGTGTLIMNDVRALEVHAGDLL